MLVDKIWFLMSEMNRGPGYHIYHRTLVMRGSGFFPTRGSRFYEIIWPAPAHPAPLYLFLQPAPPRTRDH